ncbi:cytochrome C assembly family protein [Alginatibacterium sediminis]|nr:cytochrome c biogenesis protein CcsA [Alginatibacterium sediminis]
MLLLSLAGVAMLAHGIWIYKQLFSQYGQDLSLTNVSALASLLIGVALSGFVGRSKVLFMLPLVYACAILTIALAFFFPDQYIVHFELRPQIALHIGLSLLAFTVFALACLFAIMFAYLNWNLKHHSVAAIHPALPPLMSIEASLLKLIRIGFVLLSLALISGWVFLDSFWNSGHSHKAILTSLAWLVYAVLLWGRYQLNWRGTRLIVGTISGFVLLTLAYFGSRFVREVLIN